MADNSTVKQYERGNVPQVGNPGYNEAWALIEVARRIAAVVRFGDLTNPADKRKLREALRLNLRVWTIIQAEQTVGDAGLPENIRLNILTLCKFIDRQTLDMMIEPNAEKVMSLIDINRNIAAGLMGSVSDDDLPAASEESAPAAPGENEKSGGASIKV